MLRFFKCNAGKTHGCCVTVSFHHPKQDYDIVLPLMAAAGVSSLVVELFSLAESEAPAPAPMPRDMSLEIGLKISGRVDKLMGKVQVCFLREGKAGFCSRILTCRYRLVIVRGAREEEPVLAFVLSRVRGFWGFSRLGYAVFLSMGTGQGAETLARSDCAACSASPSRSQPCATGIECQRAR